MGRIYKNGVSYGGGGGSGTASVATLTDVKLTNLQDGQTIVFDSETNNWINADTGEAVEPLSQQDVNALIALL